MKKILTIAGVLMSTVMFAGGMDENPSSKSEVAVVRKDKNTFKVFYKAPRATDVKVSIYNSANQLVYSETVRNTEGFVRPYNFGNLAEGDYTITFFDETGRLKERIAYRASATPKKVHMIKIAGNENKYMMTASGAGREQIQLSIYDAANTLVYTQSKEISGNFAEVYNLSKVKGTPTFEIVHENGHIETVKN